MGWLPIESAPVGKTMFVAKAFAQQIVGSMMYDSDPWCVWQSSLGSFERWPHRFPPTHWMPLPPPPKESKG